MALKERLVAVKYKLNKCSSNEKILKRLVPGKKYTVIIYEEPGLGFSYSLLYRGVVEQFPWFGTLSGQCEHSMENIVYIFREPVYEFRLKHSEYGSKWFVEE